MTIELIGDTIAEPLCIITSILLSTGIVPACFKIANVMQCMKMVITKNLKNHPISLLPALPKVLERVMHKIFYTLLKQNNILYKSQYGFREGYSTNLATCDKNH